MGDVRDGYQSKQRKSWILKNKPWGAFASVSFVSEFNFICVGQHCVQNQTLLRKE